MSEMDYAKMMFGWANEPSSPGDGSYSSNSSVRYGTVVKVNDGGTIDVKLDGSGTVITVKADSPHNVGDRVSVVNQGGVFIIYGMAGTLDAMEKADNGLAKQIEKKGEEILESAKADLDEVDKAFSDFKESHALTDDDIAARITASGNELSASFQGQIDDLGETYAKKTDVKADIDGFRTEMSENYQSKTDAGTMQKDLESKIQQTSDAITTEVSNRTEAVSGALKDAKSYTDQQAESISSTVEQNVTNSIGETYATKTEVQQTSEGLHATIAGEIYAAKDDVSTSVKNDLNPSISQAQANADSARTTADAAQTAANASKSFIETHFKATTSGLDVYSNANSYKARMAPGAFQILDASDNRLLSMYTNSNGAYLMSSWKSALYLGMSLSMGLFRFGSGGVEWNAASGVPMTRGGQSLGTGYYQARHLLYSNESGSAGTVALSYDAGKFDQIIICFKDADGNCGSATVPMLAQAMSADLCAAYARTGGDAGTGMFLESRTVTVSGASISNAAQRGGRFWSEIGGAEVKMAENTTAIKIIAVYGMKS